MVAVRRLALRLAIALVVMSMAIPAASASASSPVVSHGYFALPDGTQLAYTLTLPKAGGRFPTVLFYDPYAAGATSDPSWAPYGYAFIGVNFRGTGCSQGVFKMTAANIWGKDGANVVAWIAKQSWSDGKVAMNGYSFEGTSEWATAPYAGSALKAIMPSNVFPDLYRDLSYPGGVFNILDPAWIAAARQFVVGTDAFTDGLTQPQCDLNEVGSTTQDDAETFDTMEHPFRDSFWQHDPWSLTSRIHIPVLGCVNWQDTTAFPRAFNEFRSLPPKTTWLVGGDGSHYDCPINLLTRIKFLNYYLKGIHNGWQKTPHLVLYHEVTAAEDPDRDLVPLDAGGWHSSIQTWADVNKAIHPLTLYLQSGNALGLHAPTTAEDPDKFVNDELGVNNPSLFGDVPPTPGITEVTYTTPVLTHDVEFLGSGSANLWLSSSGSDTAIEVMISDVRPDGEESIVSDGFEQASMRYLDAAQSTVLEPVQTDLRQNVEYLTPGVPVYARVAFEPFDHVFRKGSRIRISIDAAGYTLLGTSLPGADSIFHTPGMTSSIVLGWLPWATAHAALLPCADLLNQPCQKPEGVLPSGTLDIPLPRGRPVDNPQVQVEPQPKVTATTG
jgi:hypothetical protein